MHVTVLGATGTVGRLVVEQALATGHEVTAVTRDAARVVVPTTVPDAAGSLHVVEADVRDAASLGPAVEGRDAVVVVLGDGRAGVVRESGTRAAVTAMRVAGVRRLVCMSTLGAGDSRGNLNLVWKHLMFGLLLRKAYADHQRQEDVVRASGLDWTIARPGALTDGPRTGDYRRGFAADDRTTALKISRADVADFLVAQLEDDSRIGSAVSLSY